MSELTEAADAAAANIEIAKNLPADALAHTPARSAIAVHPAQMITALIEKPDVDLDKVEKLFEIQERYEANEAKKAYFAAVNRFQEAAPAIYFDKEVNYSGVEFSFASLAGILKTIRPVLADCGLTLTFRTGTTDAGNPVVSACLTHELGYGEDTTLSAPPDTSGKKNPIQAVRSTVSYLKRLTAEALLGLAAEHDDDDDGQQAHGPHDPHEQFQKPPMPENLFAKNEPAYRERIQNGKGTPAQLIAKLQTKYSLSPQQMGTINGMIGGDENANA